MRWLLIFLLACLLFNGLQGWLHRVGLGRLPGDLRFRLGGREDLLDDPRVATRRSRIENGPSLYQEVAVILQQRTTAEWLDLLRTAGIPVAEVATIDDMVAALPLADHPHAGRYRVTPPLTGSVADVDIVRRHAPLQGEHNREVLAEVGYSDDDLDVLERDGVLFRAPG